jgi:hypothetical protein
VNKFKRTADRLRLAADLWLHRRGPWGLVLVGVIGMLLGFAVIVMPRLDAELAAEVATLNELQVRVASNQEGSGAAAAPATASAFHYHAFRATLPASEQVLPSIKAVLDSAASHRLISTRAEYVRAHDAHAQVETLQMMVPVNGRYSDVRHWIEEILSTQAYVAVNELAFKREEIGLNQIEAKVRLTIWHHPARPGEHRHRIDAGEWIHERPSSDIVVAAGGGRVAWRFLVTRRRATESAADVVQPAPARVKGSPGAGATARAPAKTGLSCRGFPPARQLVELLSGGPDSA